MSRETQNTMVKSHRSTHCIFTRVRPLTCRLWDVIILSHQSGGIKWQLRSSQQVKSPSNGKEKMLAKMPRGQESSAPLWNVYEPFCYLSIEVTPGAQSPHVDAILWLLQAGDSLCHMALAEGCTGKHILKSLQAQAVVLPHPGGSQGVGQAQCQQCSSVIMCSSNGSQGQLWKAADTSLVRCEVWLTSSPPNIAPALICLSAFTADRGCSPGQSVINPLVESPRAVVP